MGAYRGLFILFSLSMVLMLHCVSHAVELSGHVTGEVRHFYKSPARRGLENSNLSVSAEPELYHRFADSRDSVTVTPFVRIDENDSERTHMDIREFKWHTVSPQWELSLGFDSVFWGVTETVHLVNIINQIDMVENPDEEDLLGQPMINLTLIRDWGNVNLFVLPGFRERTFPGRKGRPGAGILVDSDHAVYESGAEEWRTDFAARWFHTLGPWDMGVSHFYGTSREPRFHPSVTTVNRYNETEWIPIYEIIHQTGVDIQCTLESWLFKFEAIHRSGQDERFFAAAAGFEYTFDDIAASGVDVGIIGEYLYDERDFKPMNDDLAMGVRLSFNDIQSTEILAAVIQDTVNGTRSFFLEAGRRLGNSFKLSVEIRGVSNVDTRDPLIAFDSDQYAQVSLGFYF